MKGKLIKREDGYYLFTDESYINAIASSYKNWIEIHNGYKLSIKNCEAIANGYDLDELASQKYLIENTGPMFMPNPHEVNNIYRQEGFKEGFQKALEILGDKKFSESYVIRAYIEGTNDGAQFESMMDYDHSDNSEAQDFSEQAEQDFRKSLQQTEWDVEIEMKYLPSLSYCNKCQKLINPLIPCIDETKSCDNWRPQLDTDGCLILKRI